MKHYALLGEKLSHSYSKLIHEYLFQKLEISADYSLWELEAEEISKAIKIAQEKKLSGFNITIPYKESLFSQIEEIDASVKAIGAMNTVSLSGSIKAYNTDCSGFQTMLEFFKISPKGKTAIILGTGGASKAVAEALRQLEIQSLLFVSRNPEGKNQIPYSDIPEADFIINTTPVGMYPNIKESPVPADIFTKFQVAIDLIYNPLETKFLQDAKSKNIIAINGLFMLAAQAIQAEMIWQNKIFDTRLYYDVYTYLEDVIYENYGYQRS